MTCKSPIDHKGISAVDLTLTAVASSQVAADPSILDELNPDEVDPGTSYVRCADGNGALSHLFFSDDDYDLARAKAICRPCGLSETCLSGAIEREEAYGVWGGKLVLDGLPVEVKAKRGRPRKHPLPAFVVDEAPIPQHLVA